MPDWPWFGWALAGSAFAGSALGYGARRILHVDDVAGAYVTVAGCLLVLVALLIGKIRYEARWRQHRLMAAHEPASVDESWGETEPKDGT